MQSLSGSLQKLRKQHHLSQEEVAERLGVSRQAVSKWESGLAVPEIELSRLYGVTLDTLLQIEPSPAKEQMEQTPPSAPEWPQQAPPSGYGPGTTRENFTSGQIKAIDDIVSHYSRAGDQVKKRQLKLSYLLCGMMAVLLVICWGVLRGQIDNLEGRLNSLQGELRDVRYDVSNQISSMNAQIQDSLKEQASLFASCQYRMLAVDPVQKTCRVAVDITPKVVTQGMQLSCTFTSEDFEAVTAQGKLQTPGSFRVEADLPLSDDIGVTAVLEADGQKQNQPMDNIIGVASGARLEIMADWGGGIRFLGVKPTVQLEGSIYGGISGGYAYGWQAPPPKKQAAVRVYRNKTLLKEWEIDLTQPDEEAAGTTWYGNGSTTGSSIEQAWDIGKGYYELHHRVDLTMEAAEGDEISIELEVTDQQGIRYIAQVAVIRIRENATTSTSSMGEVQVVYP
nr:helix-turn-helix transcriptional regulator [bacterium]